MSQRDVSNRREFLRGEAALKAVEHFADGIRSEQATKQNAAGTPNPALLLHLTRPAMAVDFQIFLNATALSADAEVACEALDLLEPLEQQMSVYRESSEISQLNRFAYETDFAVEAGLFQLLQLGQIIARETGGAYDFTSGPLTKVWGFYRRQGRMPSEHEIAKAREQVGHAKLALQTSSLSARFLHPNMELNLGGIGKGFALDRMAQHLRAGNVEHFLLHGGQSSVLAGGSRAGSGSDLGWSVGLAHPLRPAERLAEFQLRNCALGTSGSGTQYFHYQGKRYGHILDPRSGMPAEGVLSSTVIATTAAEADALSTAFYVGGEQLAREVCARQPEISALLVLPGQKTNDFQLVEMNLAPEVWRRTA